jgi:hypothetical protein
MLIDTMLPVVMLNVVMLSVVMLSVVMVSAVAPLNIFQLKNFSKCIFEKSLYPTALGHCHKHLIAFICEVLYLDMLSSSLRSFLNEEINCI